MDALHRPISAVRIPSDDDEDDGTPSTVPLRPHVLVLDDDDAPTPRKMPIPTLLSAAIVPDTPLSPSPPAVGREFPILRCTTSFHRRPPPRPEAASGCGDLICLESDEELESRCVGNNIEDVRACASKHETVRVQTAWRDNRILLDDDICMNVETEMSSDNLLQSWPKESILQGEDSVGESLREEKGEYGCLSHEDGGLQDHSNSDFRHSLPEQKDIATKKRARPKKSKDGKCIDEGDDITRIKQKKEEQAQLIEERKRKRQEEKLHKESLKAEAAEAKKIQKEKEKWEKGKFALKTIVAEIDNKIVESGTIGGHLLSRFAEKGFTFRITKNPMEKSIQWKMSIPDQISPLAPTLSEVRYVLFVYQAEEFCNMVLDGSLLDHVVCVQKKFPSFTVCYLTNKLMSYINKREQNQYKNPADVNCWKRPPVEEVLSTLTTHFTGVHSRLCIDEADLSDHIVGLTSSLASCQFRTKMTWLSINANGSLVPKGFIDRHIIKKSAWLKALIAIPRVQPRFALAIWKKYPTMRSLLNVYLDANKTVHEKEFLLKDLPVEGTLGKEDKRLGEICSKRVYRILMAQNGSCTTDDVENGADFFSSR